MNGNDLDRSLNEWFDAVEPRNEPRQILTNVFAVTRRTGQRRGMAGRLARALRLDQPLTGRDRMNRMILSVGGVAAVLVIAVIGVAYLYGPIGPGAPAGPVHVSERHGYSIRLPDDSWRVLERPGTWRSSSFFTSDDPGVDYLEERGPDGQVVENLIVYLSSQDIPDGMSFDAWAAAHDAGVERRYPCFRLQGDYENGLVGGETARIGSYQCDDFGDSGASATVQTLVAHDGRGYAIYVFPATQGTDMPALADLRAAAKNWLSRISFTD
jgi:hypothetical protein